MMHAEIRHEFVWCLVCEKNWCDHIKSWVISSQDAQLLHPRMFLNIPLFVLAPVWVNIEISDEIHNSQACRLNLHYQDRFNAKHKWTLGLWNPGEGIMSIRQVIVNWMATKLDPGEDMESPWLSTKCEAPTHSFRATQIIEDNQNLSLKHKNCWNLITEGACTHCLEGSLSSEPDDDPDEKKVNPTMPTTVGDFQPLDPTALRTSSQTSQYQAQERLLHPFPISSTPGTTLTVFVNGKPMPVINWTYQEDKEESRVEKLITDTMNKFLYGKTKVESELDISNMSPEERVKMLGVIMGMPDA
jgi:hypothetical protein